MPSLTGRVPVLPSWLAMVPEQELGPVPLPVWVAALLQAVARPAALSRASSSAPVRAQERGLAWASSPVRVLRLVQASQQARVLRRAKASEQAPVPGRASALPSFL
jgi:hypothetical protein